MDNITAGEKEIVDELRRRTINDVTPKMLEDVSLFYRFAKARDFNLLEAEAMLRKHMIWRKELQIDTILTDYKPAEVLVKYVATNLICFDKEGSIVRLVDCGRLDIKGLLKAVEMKEVGKYCAYFMEKDKDLMIKSGRNLGKPMYTPIHDYENLSYTNALSIKSVQLLTHLLKLFVDNYPETIKRITIINAPLYCTLIFSAIKQVVPRNVFEKFRIHGTGGWKEELLEIIDADGLPAYLGGTRTDPDGNPLCETFILRGRPIPKKYYINKGNKKFSLASDTEKLTVKPFSKEEVFYEVKEQDSNLELEFGTIKGDIDFSLYFKEESEDSEPVEIFPKQRMDASEEVEKSCFKCEKPGIYTIVFDNTYSWLHSKEVQYRVRIKSPKNNSFT